MLKPQEWIVIDDNVEGIGGVSFCVPGGYYVFVHKLADPIVYLRDADKDVFDLAEHIRDLLRTNPCPTAATTAKPE